MLIAEPPPTDRVNPVPPATMTITHEHVKLNQGGQRIRVTIPATPVTNALGDSFTYRWKPDVDRRALRIRAAAGRRERRGRHRDRRAAGQAGEGLVPR